MYLSDFQAVLIYCLKENKEVEEAIPSIKKIVDFFYISALLANDKAEEADTKYIQRQKRVLESFAKSFAHIHNEFKKAKKI